MNQPPLILIVDDEVYFREIFSTKLQAAGFRTEVAEDGRRGVARAKELKPDIILMDVRMPVQNGIDATLELKQEPTTKEMKIVFLTNLGESQTDMQEIDKRLSAELGAAGYIKKSEDLNAVVEQIKKFLV